MVFSSSVFLFIFLPVCLAAYFICPKRAYRNVILLVASLVFYAWGEPAYVFLMIISMVANWFAGLQIMRTPPHKKIVLIVALAINLAILGFFKYESFLANNINHLFGSDLIPDLQLPLPIGISFYTLQAISYIIDVYRGQVPAQKNMLYLGMYIAMFPQLVAGPIVRYSTVWQQIRNRKETLAKFCSGIRLFCIGLAKKVLLANVVAILADSMLSQGGSAIGASGAWGGLIAFTFQIFFDFAGYSDMAIGLGKMFGFEYLRNFNYPYISKSVTEFWRRWHISLGTFFRDYVYIPLGGNRVSKPRWAFNLFVVWFLTGFWHGASWNYVLWGLFYGLLLAIEKLWLGKTLKRVPSIFQHLYTIAAFVIGWLIFWIEDTASLGQYFLALFGAYGATGSSTLWELQAWSYWPVFIICIIASTPIIPWLREKLMAWAECRQSVSIFSKGELANAKSLSVYEQCNTEQWLEHAQAEKAPKSHLLVLQTIFLITDIVCIMLLILSIASVISGSFNPFIYFRF